MSVKPKFSKKWCLCEVHHTDAVRTPFYTSLPQYGPWDTEQKARQTGEQLKRLEYEHCELAVREFAEGGGTEARFAASEAANDF